MSVFIPVAYSVKPQHMRFTPASDTYTPWAGVCQWCSVARRQKLECLAGVRVWAVENGKDAAGDLVKQWRILTPTFHADANSSSLEFTAEDLKTLLNAIDANGGETLAQGFCEVLLKQPTVGEYGWSKNIDCTDTWMFPFGVWVGPPSSFGGRSWNFLRPPEERGEVPDWDWLYKTYGDKYPEAKAVIKGK